MKERTNMTKKEYLDLYQKSLEGKCNKDELERLSKYEDDFEWLETDKVDPAQRERVFSQLMTTIAAKENMYPVPLWKRIIAVACLVVICTIALIYFTGKDKPNDVRQQIAKKTVIRPGSNKATLTLSDGRTILLDSVVTGKLASESGTTIVKMKDGEIAYEVTASPKEQVAFNTIAVPKGGQYHLTLPDGTRVWLNAATTLRFPTRFAGHTREVELDGEAYFEVAKHKQLPFFVSTHQMKVKVLGTHFNVMAYKDEPQITTTLLEGKVMLYAAAKNIALDPGEQGLFTAGRFKVKKADIDEAMAWKNGYFIFNGEDLTAIMRKISRWYDVDIDYNTQNNKLTYTGSVSRFNNIAEVLKVLSLTGTVRFDIRERRILVTN